MGKLWRRVYFLLHRQRFERELADEMDAHREMMSPELRSQFGNTTRLSEQSREAWSWNWLEQLFQDLSYGIRVLRRAPVFTMGAVMVLALGVGANLAEFQIFDAMIFHRLTIRDAESCLQFVHASRQGQRLGFPSGAVDFYRAESRSFAWLVAEDRSVEVVMEGDSGLRSNLVSANYFGSLGIVASWGRLLDARDAQPDAAPVAVLGYSYWQTRFAGDPGVVGRVVHVSSQPVQIVGVLPYSFEGLMARGTVVWFPDSIRPVLLPGSAPVQQDFSRPSTALYGKLKSGVPQAAGEAELTSLTRELARRQPHSFQEDERVQGHLVQESMLRSIQHYPAIAVFMVMVLLVLLSACANLANMLLARGLARQREIDIRLAIGASRTRIVRQLMTENLLLAMLGAGAGMACGVIFARLLLYALNAPPGFRITMRWQILAAGFFLAFLAAVAFGLPAALRTARPNHRKIRLRQSLVGVQVAVSCLLLIASGVLAHNGILSASVDLAFDYRNMIVVYPQLYGRNLTTAVAQQKLDELSTRLKELPGVEAVTAAVVPPLSGRLRMEHPPGLPHVYKNAVAASYFTVMNLPFVLGRTFSPGETALIVSESAARAVWPNQNPVGKRWKLSGVERTVVGVVRDSGANLLADPESVDSVEAYLPIQGTDVEGSALILHTRGDPAVLARLIPSTAATVNEPVSVTLVRGSRENLLEAQRKMVTLFGSIGAVATALAAAGMFALVAFALAQRRRELGIRIAIGATPRHILGILATQNARPMAAGAFAGVILAATLTPLVRSLIVLQNRGAVDVIGFAAGLGVFVLAAGLATLSPAMRSLRIDPCETLREEERAYLCGLCVSALKAHPHLARIPELYCASMKSAVLLLVSFTLCAAEKIEILRDEFGVPHIYAATAAGAAFASGYAQAEDRLEELLRNYRKAEGTMSEAFGPEFLTHDYRQRLWRHRDVARQHYAELAPNLRAICEAYQAGIKKFMQEHPEQVPAWAPKLEPWQIIALGRYIIWSWPEGEAGGDLLRGGVQPDPVAYHGSNEMALAPSRTALHVPIAVIDPHLTWYGEVRFYEMRIYGGDLAFSGAAILGQPFPSLGHSRYLSIAMTTGGPDTSDIYEEDVRDGKYKFKDEWRPLEVRTERIGVKAGAEIKFQDMRIESTHHGPIVAHKNGKAYSAAIPYANEFRLIETAWKVATARNLAQAKAALSGLQYMAQNIMIATVDGDIYYVRNGRVPVRPNGCDPSRPMSGPAGACEWQGLHTFEDLVQIANPPQGYMQNCNTSPFNMMKDSPLVPENWAAHPYIYNDSRRPPSQRAAMVRDLLDGAHDVTAEQAIDIAFSPQVWHAELWQDRIRKAAPDHEVGKLIAGWNRRSDADSRAALAYYVFKMALGGTAARATEPPDTLTDEAIRTALDQAAQRLKSEYAAGAVFGTVFRVGRKDATRTFPVGGGTLAEAGMATPRAISFSPRGKEMVGHTGQTSTQIVILTKPPQSYMVLPLGESDHPDSPHYDDQAEKLFSKSRAKSTYFLNRKELEKHVTAKKSLSY